MSKHTPGPWHLYADRVKDDPFDRIRYTVVATGKTICRIHYSSYEGGPTNAEYDAKLVTVAPDLLEALRSAVEWGAPFKDAPRNSRPEWFDKANAAITKATGDKE